MNRGLWVLGFKPRVGCLFVLFFAVSAATVRAGDRWLHVKVDDAGRGGEKVRVNVPLSLAEKVLPCIHANNLEGGKVRIRGDVNGVDLRALVDAVRSTDDNAFVTVEDRHDNVRVAKVSGNLIVKVREDQNRSQVDIKVPFTVVEALLSGGKDELDVTAGLRALRTQGDTELVTVNDNSQTVRIWVDSRNTGE